MTGLSRWLKVQNERGDIVVAHLNKARATLLKERDEKLVSNRDEMTSAREAVEATEEKRKEADELLQSARAKEAEARAALEAASPDQRLAEFVRSRTEDYESYLV